MSDKCKYEWAAPAISADPNEAAREFHKIIRREGVLTPEAVVESARSPKSPLHHDIEWDDEVAASAYRRGQAAHLIRSLVTVRMVNDQPIKTRVFVKVQSVDVSQEAAHGVTVTMAKDAPSPRAKEEGAQYIAEAIRPGAYIPLDRALNVPPLRDALIARAKADMRAFVAKYSHLSELAKVVAAMREAIGDTR